jgi:hypothetical protein
MAVMRADLIPVPFARREQWAKESHALCESIVYDAAILQAVKAVPSGAEVANVQLPEALLPLVQEIRRPSVRRRRREAVQSLRRLACTRSASEAKS